jgi:glyoxylase-like metal-dependent hydrolase (beta-lactamase superfamily II)
MGAGEAQARPASSRPIVFPILRREAGTSSARAIASAAWLSAPSKTCASGPGHSPGHLAFWREQDRVLVLGDVLFNLRLPTGRPGLQLPPSALTADPVTNLASARRLGALQPEIVCFGHGPPLRDGDRFQRFVADAMVRNH